MSGRWLETLGTESARRSGAGVCKCIQRGTSEREEGQGQVGEGSVGPTSSPPPALGQGLSVEGKAPSSEYNRPGFKSWLLHSPPM